MAEFLEIPILKAGNYKGLEIRTEDLERMVQSANINVPYIKQLSQKQPEFPSYINFNHSDILPETLKDTTKDVSPLFGIKTIDGEQWIVVSLQNVSNDIADTIVKHFPFRSVEIIHNLHNPIDNKDYQNVIRSIGFLDKYTPPAVKGQDDRLSVIYNKESIMDSRITTVLTEYTQDDIETKEIKPMAEDKHDDKQMTIFKEEDVKALIEEQVKHKEEELKADYKMKVEQLAAEKHRLEEEIQEKNRKAFESEIAMFEATLEDKYHITPAGMEVIKAMLEPMNYNMVTKLSEDESSPLDAFKNGITKLTELVKKGTLLLNEEKITKPGGSKEPGSIQEQRAEAIASFMEKAGGSYNDAWSLAAKSEDTKHLFLPQYAEK